MEEIKIYVHGDITVENIPDHVQIRVFDERSDYVIPEHRKDEDFAISVSWHVADVRNAAHEKGMNITTNQAIGILKTIKRDHNAELGINWSTINDSLDQIKE